MPKDTQEQPQEETTQQFDRMPGSDPIEEAETVDLNFGLGEAPVEEEEEETTDDVSEVEEDDAEPEETVDEVDAEEDDATETTEIEAEAEPETPKLGEEPVMDEEKTPPKKQMVPKSRLDEVLAKQKALQKQLDDLKAQQPEPAEAPADYDFEAKEVEYQNLLLDGESSKAAALRAEIRRAEREQIAHEMRQEMGQTVQEATTKTALQQAADNLAEAFPVFDESSPDFDSTLTQEVVDLRDAFMIKGENAVAALNKASQYVINMHGLVDNEPATAPAKAPADEVGKKRAEIARKLKAAGSQPPEMAGESSASNGEKAVNIADLSEEEFNALPEATLKRLRGDIL